MVADDSADRDFRPTASWRNLRLRAELLARLRAFFAHRGFVEVETPILSADVAVERHIDPFAVPMAVGDGYGGRQCTWLQPSPELGMKRLLAAGADSPEAPAAIYQVTRSFRKGERGRLHNAEFTIVEWYRRGDSINEGMALLSDLVAELLRVGEAERISYAEAFSRYAAVDPHRDSPDALAAAASRLGVDIPQSMRGCTERDAWLELLLVSSVEPHLGAERPAIIYDYPASQAVLASVRPGSPPLAERFELYFRGIELANGYYELTDADALALRQEEINRDRLAAGHDALPEENLLLAAMRHGLPICAGAALGFDRVVMLAAGATSIDEVIAFPSDRA